MARWSFDANEFFFLFCFISGSLTFVKQCILKSVRPFEKRIHISAKFRNNGFLALNRTIFSPCVVTVIVLLVLRFYDYSAFFQHLLQKRTHLKCQIIEKSFIFAKDELRYLHSVHVTTFDQICHSRLYRFIM